MDSPSSTRENAQAPACYYVHFDSRDEVRMALEPYAKTDGYFLLRNSLENNVITISVIHNCTIFHMRIMEDNLGRCYLEDRPNFSSIGELLQYYRTNDLPNAQQIKHLRLLYPITELHNGIRGKVIHQRPSQRASVPEPPQPSLEIQRNRSRSLIDRTQHSRSVGTPEAVFLDPHRRPPEPEPRVEKAPTYARHFYSRIPKAELDKMPEFLKWLRLQEAENDVHRCACGLLISESRLPNGWEVHRSDEPLTRGRLFFTSPEKQSHWKLPESINDLLSLEHLETLSRLRAIPAEMNTRTYTARSQSESDAR